jgi:hypothetical protein
MWDARGAVVGGLLLDRGAAFHLWAAVHVTCWLAGTASDLSWASSF